MKIDPQKIALLCPADTVVRVVECDSTNNYARANSVAKDTIYIALEQRGGKGRDGKIFLSERGGIYFSVVLKRSSSYMAASRYPLFCALSVRSALILQGIKSDVKWPNDLLVNDKKLCGILCENNAVDGNLILGIGVNAENGLGEFEDIAISAQKLGVALDADRLISDIYKNILVCEQTDFNDVLTDYRAACITIGKFIPDYGRAIAIDGDGFLVVENGSKKTVIYNPIG